MCDRSMLNAPSAVWRRRKRNAVCSGSPAPRIPSKTQRRYKGRGDCELKFGEAMSHRIRVIEQLFPKQRPAGGASDCLTGYITGIRLDAWRDFGYLDSARLFFFWIYAQSLAQVCGTGFSDHPDERSATCLLKTLSAHGSRGMLSLGIVWRNGRSECY